MARQSNAAYWAQRLKNMEEALLDQSYSYVENLEAQFSRAQAEIEKQIAAWYQRFASNNEISLAEAKRLLNSDELAEFHWTVGDYIAYGKQNAIDGMWMKQLENASARVHISRLDALKLQIQQQAEALYANQLDSVDAAARQIYEGSYYHTAFEVQKGLGVGWTTHAINEETIKKVLSRPWTADNQTFRDRCWTNKQNLVNSVNTQLTQMIIRGEAPDRAIAAISKQFEVSKSKAGRLVMTESAYFASAAQKDCYKELDVEQYQIVAALDRDTCDICGSLDGKVFKMSEYQEGLTAPPLHPWCRCCTAPYFADMEGLGERFARDAETGERYKVPRDMTYEQWKAKQDELHGAGTVDRLRKMGYNTSEDTKQWERYKELLGKNAPKSLSAFQNIKYGGEWDAFKAYSKSIRKGDLTPLASFELYQNISSDIDKQLVGIVTQNGMTIVGKSHHYIDRTIGSVAQRRSGVEVGDALDALLHPVKIDPVRVNADGKRSQRFKGKNCYVTVNPDTNILIQTNPHISRKGKK